MNVECDITYLSAIDRWEFKTGDKREPEERMSPGENESWEREAYWGSNCYPLDLSGRSVLDDRP